MGNSSSQEEQNQRREAERREAERREAERREAERREAERREAERREAERREAQRKESEKLEIEHIEEQRKKEEVTKFFEDTKLYYPGSTLSDVDNKEGIYRCLNILVAGLRHAGKSSLVNTILRVLNSEWDKPFHYYSDVGSRSENVTNLLSAISPKEFKQLCILDCFAATTLDNDELHFFTNCVTKGVRPGGTKSHYIVDTKYRCQAIIIVVSPSQLKKDDFKLNLKQLMKSLVVADRRPIVVITHQDELESSAEAEVKSTAKELFNTQQVICLSTYRECDNHYTPRNYNIDKAVLLLIQRCFSTADRVFNAEYLAGRTTE